METDAKSATSLEIMEAVAKETGITVRGILSKVRSRPLPFARHLVCYFMSEYEGKTNEVIARALGGLDQSAAFYGTHKIKKLKKESVTVQGIVNSIKLQVYGPDEED